MTTKFITLALLGSCTFACAGKPKTVNKDWEQACGGSNIAITSVAGQVVAIDAFAEHSAEAKQWICLFDNGKVVSVMYRHSKVTRKPSAQDGEFTTELDEDRVEVFHFPDHDLSNMPPELKEELSKIIAIAES